MSRFLARAIAAAQALAPAAPSLAQPLRRGFGDFGDFGGRAETAKAPPARTPRQGFGDYGGFGERAENENAPPGVSIWTEGSDYSLTSDAVEIAHILDEGGEIRWCPNHGLDVTRADGRYLGISPSRAGKLRALGLLSATVLEAAP